ncbi:MAG: sigma-54-dependent Fis family transcriptional regulator [Calditrichaeota bacterium]|nr:MAG: sigma-54-dependent Fis family transcriptional regulator [Calditrichota bacterium]
MIASRILIVDDDPFFLRNMRRLLETHDYRATTLANPGHVKQHLEENGYHCVLLDVKMPGLNGLEVLRQIRQMDTSLPVIMISGEGNIDIAVQALKQGAYDFIEKSDEPDKVLKAIQNAIERKALIEAADTYLQELQQKYSIIGKSRRIREVLDKIAKVAQYDCPVLITGETGTGKSLAARAIHYQSPRRGKPFIHVNCAAIPPELLESELFGHKKGAFTGAHQDQPGKFLAADGGTLFMDEIGEMDVKMQAKLLNVLQDQEVQVVGEAKPQKVNVRIIAATNKDPQKLVQERKLREDLFHRLNVVDIHIPPLRERPEDVLLLAYHFLKKYCDEYNKSIVRFHPQVESLLMCHSWPGNVRELENFVRKMIIFTDTDEVTMEDLFRSKVSPENFNDLFAPEQFARLKLNQAHDLFESGYLRYILDKCNWDVQEAASIVGIDPSNLYKKMRKHGLHKPKPSQKARSV